MHFDRLRATSTNCRAVAYQAVPVRNMLLKYGHRIQSTKKLCVSYNLPRLHLTDFKCSCRALHPPFQNTKTKAMNKTLYDRLASMKLQMSGSQNRQLEAGSSASSYAPRSAQARARSSSHPKSRKKQCILNIQ